MFIYLFFYFAQDLRALSTDRHETLTRDQYLLRLDNAGPKTWGPSAKSLGPKTCKIWGDFTQLPNLIANISGTRQDIQNRKANVWRTIPPTFSEINAVNFGTLSRKYDTSLDPPKLTFLGDYISAPRGVGP